MTDRRGKYYLSVGLRNNNPGNILRTAITWKGEISGNTGLHEIFISSEYGLRALYKQIITTTKRTAGDPYAFAQDYTGANYLIVNNYSTAITKAIAPGQRIELNKADILKVAKVLVKFENGKDHKLIQENEYLKAWELLNAKNGTTSQKSTNKLLALSLGSLALLWFYSQ